MGSTRLFFFEKNISLYTMAKSSSETLPTFWILDVVFPSMSDLKATSKAPLQTPAIYSRRLLMSSSLLFFTFVRAMTLDHCMDVALWNILVLLHLLIIGAMQEKIGD